MSREGELYNELRGIVERHNARSRRLYKEDAASREDALIRDLIEWVQKREKQPA